MYTSVCGRCNPTGSRTEILILIEICPKLACMNIQYYMKGDSPQGYIISHHHLPRAPQSLLPSPRPHPPWGSESPSAGGHPSSQRSVGTTSNCNVSYALQFAWGRVYCSLHGGGSAAVCMGAELLQFAWGQGCCSLHGGGSTAVCMGEGEWLHTSTHSIYGI